MKTIVCANFGQCRVVLKPEDSRIQIEKYTYCMKCAEARKK